MQRGRKGADHHLTLISPDATNIQRPITALKPLSPPEQKIFSMVAAENPHLRQSDSVLLTAFAKAGIGSFNTDNAQDFERLSRTLMSLATKLRISPQSRVDPKSLGRRIADQPVGPRCPKPWDRDRDRDDDDDDEEDGI